MARKTDVGQETNKREREGKERSATRVGSLKGNATIWRGSLLLSLVISPISFTKDLNDLAPLILIQIEDYATCWGGRVSFIFMEKLNTPSFIGSFIPSIYWTSFMDIHTYMYECNVIYRRYNYFYLGHVVT